MFNAYFTYCTNYSGDCDGCMGVKIGLNWYKHARRKEHNGFSLVVYLVKWQWTFTFVTNHAEYVKLITRDGRWSFDHFRLLPLPLPKRKVDDGTQKSRNRNKTAGKDQ